MKALTAFALLIILLGIMGLQNASANCAGDYWGDYHSLYLADISHPCPNSDSHAEYSLYGSSGADFDLYVLDTWNNTWYSSKTTAYNEFVRVPIHCGYQHKAYVWTYSGNGSWSVCSPQVAFDAGFRQLAYSDTAPDIAYGSTDTTTGSVSSGLIGRWALSFDWGCDGSPGEDVVIFNSDGTFGDNEDYANGEWTRDGQGIRWEHDEDPNALYRGQIFGLYMSGTMSTTDGQTGCWTASKES
ncbi:MAG: hypothetical protein MUE87_00430 [Methanothrix sp.]|jgi:hypothetical protein|nr:hypothetical protein [Methanothrix sp.]